MVLCPHLKGVHRAIDRSDGADEAEGGGPEGDQLPAWPRIVRLYDVRSASQRRLPRPEGCAELIGWRSASVRSSELKAR